jgi:hypothetical protein
MKFFVQETEISDNDYKFIKILNLNTSHQTMTQQIVAKESTETEMVCTSCKHFIEMEGVFFCRYFDAFLSMETLCIPCDFQENIELPVF